LVAVLGAAAIIKEMLVDQAAAWVVIIQQDLDQMVRQELQDKDGMAVALAHRGQQAIMVQVEVVEQVALVYLAL
jgi:hypothetical protein